MLIYLKYSGYVISNQLISILALNLKYDLLIDNLV